MDNVGDKNNVLSNIAEHMFSSNCIIHVFNNFFFHTTLKAQKIHEGVPNYHYHDYMHKNDYSCTRCASEITCKSSIWKAA